MNEIILLIINQLLCKILHIAAIHLMVGRGTLQETICTVTLPRQAPCQGWVAAPALPWEWRGLVSIDS